MTSLLEPFQVPSAKNAELEVEVRFGRFASGKDGFNIFIPGVSSDVFYTLQKTLMCTQFEYSRVMLFEGRERRVDTADTYADLMSDRYSKSVYQQKENKSTVNVPALGARISAAYETTIGPVTSKPTGERKRIRCEKVFGPYTFHITHVMQPNKSDIYEVEVELDTKKLTVKDDESVMRHLKTLYRITYNTVTISSTNAVGNLNQELDFETPDKEMFDTENVEISEKPVRNNEVNFNFNKPIDMDLERYIRVIKSEDYTVSLKADGVHGFLLHDKTGCHVITGRTMVNTLTLEGVDKTTVLEGEMVTIKGVSFFIAFDVLKHDGEYTLGMAYTDRLTMLQRICEMLSTKLPVAMKQVFSSHITISLNRMLKTEKKNPDVYYAVKPVVGVSNFVIKKLIEVPLYETDGVVFTSKKPYITTQQSQKPGARFVKNQHVPVYKWKPQEQLTIDFQVGNSYNLLVVNNKELVVFNGSNEVPIRAAVLEREDQGKISIGQIGEFRLNKVTSGNVAFFKFIRPRQDKKFPNSSFVARDVWTVLHNHVSLDTLVGNDLTMIRKHHNQVKKDHIMKYIKHDDVVLDLGGGRGGDLEKYIDSEARAVVFVEPNSDNLSELQSRIEGLKRKYKTNSLTFKNTTFYWLQVMGQETAKIAYFMQKLNLVADVVAMFFSLTFFYETENDLVSLANTVRKCSRPGSLLIGTVMDGNATKRYIESGLKVNYFQVKLTGKKQYTDQVLIQLPKDTIVGDQIENLVYFDWLAKKLDTQCYQYQVFPDWDELSESSTNINHLYYSFALKNTPSFALEVGETKVVSGSLYQLGTEGTLTAALMTAISSSYRESDDKDFISNLHLDLSEYLKKDKRYYKYFSGDVESDMENIINLGLNESHLAFLSDLYGLNIIVLNCLYRIDSINGKKKDWEVNHRLTALLYRNNDRYDTLVRVQKNVPCEDETDGEMMTRYVLPTHDFRINQLLEEKTLQ